MTAPIDTLRRDGILPMGKLWDFANIAEYLEQFPTYPGHVKRSKDSTDTRCYDMAAVLQVPGLLRLALAVTPFVERYLEREPLIYSFNAFWTTKAERTHPGLQEFHRDKDDEKFLALMFYGTDVLTPDDGPHEYQRGTHDGSDKGDVLSIGGPKGTAFFMDGRGLHRGRMPTHDRLLAWVRWGISDPPLGYIKDGTSPVSKDIVPDYPSDPYLQNSIRLVAA